MPYGADYSRYANCLVANNFANATGQPSLVQTSSPTCFNPAVAAAILPFVGAHAPVLAAFARLPINPPPLIVNFGGAPFTNSGFTNVSLAFGGGLRTFNGVATDDRYEQKDTNWSLFTHNIFSITDRLKLTAGVRYTHDKKKLDVDLPDNNTLCAFFSGTPALAALQTLPCVIPSAPGGFYSDSAPRRKASGPARSRSAGSRSTRSWSMPAYRAAIRRAGSTSIARRFRAAAATARSFRPPAPRPSVRAGNQHCLRIGPEI